MRRKSGRKVGAARALQQAAEYAALMLYWLGQAAAYPEVELQVEVVMPRLAAPAAGLEQLARDVAAATMGQRRLMA